jgi:hypothetical protein
LIVTGAILLLAYYALYSAFVVRRPQMVEGTANMRFWVVGYIRQAAYRDNGLSDDETLERAGFDPEKAWTRGSLTAVRISLLGSYTLAFSLLTAGLAVLGTVEPPK